jgi:uncharacterized protein (DUF1778 family)
MINTNKIVAARFTVEDASLLREVAKQRGMDVSDFVRYAVRKELARLSYLSDEDKKALGVKAKEEKI